jgi:chemotaxis protein MotB
MAVKKRKHEEDENWAISLSDMVMNLMCFFILLLAMSQVDQKKYAAVAESLGTALGAKQAAKPQEEVPTGDVRLPVDTRQKDLAAIRMQLSQRISNLKDYAEVEQRADSVALSLKSAVLFDLGRADLRSKDQAMLDAVTAPLLDIPCRIVVQSAQFPSNWELSAARASAVARYLIGKGFAKDRLQIVGYADTKPVVPNDSAKGDPLPDNQARNRRIVILVSP